MDTFSGGMAALLLEHRLDKALKNTELSEMGQKPFSISLFCCCVPLKVPAKSCFLFLVGREKPGIIIHIICPVSDSFAAVTAAAWQQLKVQHLLNGGSGPGNHGYVPSQNRELLRRSLAGLPSGSLRAVKDSHLGRHAVRALCKKFLKTEFWISLKIVPKCKICASKK